MSTVLEQFTLPTVLTAIGMGAAVVISLIRLATRVSLVEFKVQTMWNFQMRRGFSEVVATGVGTLESPLRFNDDIERALDPIRDRLLEYARGHFTEQTSDSEALLMLEDEFGDELLRFVCVPKGLSHGACLLLALTVARGRNEVHLTAPKRLLNGDGRWRRWLTCLP
jgi:hypothetical protein